MSRAYAVFSILLILTGSFIFWKAIECEEPDKLTVALTQLECAKSIDVPALGREVCQKVYGVSECQLQESDRQTLYEAFNKKVDDCAKAALKDANKCIDKYEGI